MTGAGGFPRLEGERLDVLAKTLLCSGAALLCANALAAGELPFPEERSSLETAERVVTGVALAGDAVFVFSKNPKLMLRVPFQAAGKEREARFGKLEAQERVPLPGAEGGAFRGLEHVLGRYVVFDGARLAVAEVDAKSGKTIVERSIPWDLIRPPEDRGGEATRSETAEAQVAFKRRLLAAPPLKLAGVARVPDSWRVSRMQGMGQVYFAATRIEGFPLLQIECREDEASQCMVTRYCKLGTPLGIPPEAVAGIGLSEKRRLIVFGDTTSHGFFAYQWQSCFHSPRAKPTWKLPGKIKSLSGFTVDQAGRLWVASDMRDDYLNASVYVFETW